MTQLVAASTGPSLLMSDDEIKEYVTMERTFPTIARPLPSPGSDADEDMGSPLESTALHALTYQGHVFIVTGTPLSRPSFVYTTSEAALEVNKRLASAAQREQSIFKELEAWATQPACESLRMRFFLPSDVLLAHYGKISSLIYTSCMSATQAERLNGIPEFIIDHSHSCLVYDPLAKYDDTAVYSSSSSDDDGYDYADSKTIFAQGLLLTRTDVLDDMISDRFYDQVHLLPWAQATDPAAQKLLACTVRALASLTTTVPSLDSSYIDVLWATITAIRDISNDDREATKQCGAVLRQFCTDAGTASSASSGDLFESVSNLLLQFGSTALMNKHD